MLKLDEQLNVRLSQGAKIEHSTAAAQMMVLFVDRSSKQGVDEKRHPVFTFGPFEHCEREQFEDGLDAVEKVNRADCPPSVQ